MKKLGKNEQAKRAEELAEKVRDTAGTPEHHGDISHLHFCKLILSSQKRSCEFKWV